MEVKNFDSFPCTNNYLSIYLDVKKDFIT